MGCCFCNYRQMYVKAVNYSMSKFFYIFTCAFKSCLTLFFLYQMCFYSGFVLLYLVGGEQLLFLGDLYEVPASCVNVYYVCIHMHTHAVCVMLHKLSYGFIRPGVV